MTVLKYFEKSSKALSLLALTLVVLSGITVSAQEHGDPRWVTTWITSPSTLPPSEEQAAAVDNQTLRLVVHTSVGGSSLRLRLSNAHGTAPVTIGGTRVALHSEGSSIRSGSSSAVSFGGQQAVTLARGAVILSDPLAFDVPELSNLSVSLYLPEASGFLTAHA